MMKDVKQKLAFVFNFGWACGLSSYALFKNKAFSNVHIIVSRLRFLLQYIFNNAQVMVLATDYYVQAAFLCAHIETESLF